MEGDKSQRRITTAQGRPSEKSWPVFEPGRDARYNTEISAEQCLLGGWTARPSQSPEGLVMGS